MSLTRSLISFSFLFLLCFVIEINAMVISTQLQAFTDINTLVRIVVCLEMYNSMNSISYIYHNIFIQRLVFNYSIMKSFQFIDNDFG